MVTANSREELELKKTNVKNYLDSLELRAVTLRFEQETLLKSMLPIFPKQKIEQRIGITYSFSYCSGNVSVCL